MSELILDKDDPTKTAVQLRCGLKAKILHVEDGQIFGWRERCEDDGGGRQGEDWDLRGRCYPSGVSELDLVNAPRVVKLQVRIGLYPTGANCAYHAEKCSVTYLKGLGCIGSKLIEVEVTEGVWE